MRHVAAVAALMVLSVGAHGRGWELYRAKGFEKVEAIVEIQAASGGMVVSAVRIEGGTPEIIKGIQRILFTGDVTKQAETQTVRAPSLVLQDAPKPKQAPQVPIGAIAPPGGLSVGPALIPAPEPQQPFTLSGQGQQVVPSCFLRAGLRTVTFIHQGRSNFSVELLDANGGFLDLIANTIGNISGSKGVQVKADGQYALNVHSEGVWEISIE